MGDFRKVAEKVAIVLDELRRKGGVSPAGIPGLLEQAMGDGISSVNCYPGFPGDECHEIAYFFSLTSKSYRGNTHGHFGCKGVLQKLVQHMQGHCLGKTRIAVVITDNWEAWAYDVWKSNIDEIKKAGNLLEVYLLTHRNASEIQV